MTDTNTTKPPLDLRGKTPENWYRIDCGFNTAPDCFDRVTMEKAIAAMRSVISTADSFTQGFDERTEVYHVRDNVWQRAGMGRHGGCLCVGCLEKRIKRTLKPKDFPRKHPLNGMPGTPRLLQRQGRW